jgi:hypothetical protein
MEIRLKRGSIKKGVTDFYFFGLEHYDDFDWFLDLFLRSGDTKLLERINGIYSITAKLESQGICCKLIQPENIGFYAERMEDEAQESLANLEQILVEILEYTKKY